MAPDDVAADDVAPDDSSETAKDADAPSVDTVWAFSTGGDDRPDRLWIGTIPGGLFKSEDNGASWQLVEALWNREERSHWFGGGSDKPGIHSVVVDPRNSDHVTVGVSCGGVWQTFDAGASWELTAAGMFADYMPPEGREDQRIQDPHLIAQCPAEPDVLYCQHHNAVFTSRDGGRNWRSLAVQPSVFGFPVAVHPHDANTAWFVPAVKDDSRVPVDGAVCVSRTRDGGETFEVLRNGLPQKDAYDIVYRHALAVDASGDVLAMGSTTGNLWLSEDGGDNWQHLSAHMPPVYAVCWAE